MATASSPPVLPSQSEQRIHATCVALGNKGVLLRGKSGSGKSDLALRLISQPLIWLKDSVGPTVPPSTDPCLGQLVGDDQIIVWKHTSRLMARPDPRLAGKLEVRGLGIVTVPFVSQISVALVVDLVSRNSVPRMPEAEQCCEINGVRLPLLVLSPFEASAVAKLSLAARQMPTNF